MVTQGTSKMSHMTLGQSKSSLGDPGAFSRVAKPNLYILHEVIYKINIFMIRKLILCGWFTQT